MCDSARAHRAAPKTSRLRQCSWKRILQHRGARRTRDNPCVAAAWAVVDACDDVPNIQRTGLADHASPCLQPTPLLARSRIMIVKSDIYVKFHGPPVEDDWARVNQLASACLQAADAITAKPLWLDRERKLIGY